MRHTLSKPTRDGIAKQADSQQSPQLQNALVECVDRFLLCLPAEELEDRDRIYFSIQEAHWFYRDHLCEGAGVSLPRLSLGAFGSALISSCELLRSMFPSEGERTALYERWREYCKKVPQIGCILLNAELTKAVLVQSKGHWMFPRSKVNQGEKWAECAYRVAEDDLGVEASPILLSDSPYLDYADPETNTFARFFIAKGVELPPDAGSGLDGVEWFPLEELPGWSDRAPAGSFYIVEPLVAGLRKWCKEERRSPATVPCVPPMPKVESPSARDLPTSFSDAPGKYRMDNVAPPMEAAKGTWEAHERIDGVAPPKAGVTKVRAGDTGRSPDAAEAEPEREPQPEPVKSRAQGFDTAKILEQVRRPWMNLDRKMSTFA
jgi:mRNA-decapping enzyme subunit 2